MKVNCNNKEGSRIRFKDEERPFKIMCRNTRYMVCVSQYSDSESSTKEYTIVDLENSIRGTEYPDLNLKSISDSDCNRLLRKLDSGSLEISKTNRVRAVILDPRW